MKENKKILYTGVALLLAAVIAIAAILAAVLPGTRTAPSPMGQLSADPQESGRGISLVTEPIAREEYDEYGISPLAEDSFTVTATVNEDAFVKEIRWEVSFDESDDVNRVWASGKTASDYVSVAESDELSATVSCLKAFGCRILVTAVSKDDPNVKASCACSYRQRLTGATFTATATNDRAHDIQGLSLTMGNRDMIGKIYYGETYSWNAMPILSDATITGGVIQICSVSVSLNRDAISHLQSGGFTVSSPGTYQLTVGQQLSNVIIDDSFLTTVFGQNAIAYRTLYDALHAMEEQYENLLDVTMTFTRIGAPQELNGLPLTLAGYMNLDYESLYRAVSDVQVDQTEHLF